jgi:NADP-dependent 3-hydroxy acid dehydrogenase YdfG
MTQVGLVSGAASGIGAACAQRLVGTVDVLVDGGTCAVLE